ncbi:hypothetical protein B0H13DRAFT_1932443 [Mycena leptocephala]|nr:hypothetical protein B0H13DRAFT_1932443 [Mycena leptocephala]
MHGKYPVRAFEYTRTRHPLLNSWTIHRATTLLAEAEVRRESNEVQTQLGPRVYCTANLRVPFRFRNPWYGRVATRTGVIAPGAAAQVSGSSKDGLIIELILIHPLETCVTRAVQAESGLNSFVRGQSRKTALRPPLINTT